MGSLRNGAKHRLCKPISCLRDRYSVTVAGYAISYLPWSVVSSEPFSLASLSAEAFSGGV